MAISSKRKAAILEDVMHTLNFHRKVTEDLTRVESILKLVDAYVEASGEVEIERALLELADAN